MTQSGPKPTAENDAVAVKNDDRHAAHSNLNLLSVGLSYGSDLLKGTRDSIVQPVAGAKNLLGYGNPDKSEDIPASTEPQSLAYRAGAMLGQAIDFGIVQTVSHKIPILKALGRTGSAMSTGFTMGFLSAPSHDSAHPEENSLKARLTAGLEGAVTIGVMEGGSKGLSRLGISDSLAGRVAKSTISGAAAGALSTQIESKATTGHFASLQDTAMAAATWGLTGAAFATAPSVARGIKTKFDGIEFGSKARTLTPELRATESTLVQNPEAPRAVIDLTEGRRPEPSSSLQIKPRRANAENQIIEWHDLRDLDHEERPKPFDHNLQSTIVENHSQLSDPLKEHLGAAAEAVANKVAPNKPLSASDLVGKDFDSKTFASIYDRLYASSANYEVLGLSKEQWLAESALRLTKALGAQGQDWLERSEQFKSKFTFGSMPVDPEKLDVGRIRSIAEQIPLMSTTEQEQAALVKRFVMESAEVSAKDLHMLTSIFKSDPDGAIFLLGKAPSEATNALKVLHALPDLPTPLAVEYAGEPYAKQLAVSFAWKKLTPQLNAEEIQRFRSVDFQNNSPDIQTKFLKDLESIESLGTRRLLQDTALTPNVVTELYPGLSQNEANSIVNIANRLSKSPFDLITNGFNPDAYVAARKQLNENSSKILRINSLWDRDEKAFQIVNTFGADYKEFLDQVDAKLAKSHYSRDQFFSDLRLPLRSRDESKPLADFLLRNPDLSISETNSLLARLNTSSNDNFKNILSSSDSEIRSAAKGWMLAPDLPFALAAEFGDKKTIETTAAALTYFEQLDTVPSTIGNFDSLKSDSPHFENFWQKYPETLAKGKHALIAEANSVRAAIGAFHPNLSERHALALESAAMTTQEPLQYIGADAKAGVFGKVFDRLVASSKDADGDWQARSALATTNTFGRNALHWLDKQARKGDDLHDATRWLPLYSPKEASGLGDFLNANAMRNTRELRLVANRWTQMDDEIKKLPFRKIISKLRDQAYENVESPALAREAFNWDVAAADYPKHEQRFLDSLDTPSPFPLEKSWNVENLTGRFLPRSDPRGLFLGEHTHCCQHPGEAGSACAWFGQENARSGFFVVENKAKEIVAQSWAWISDQNGLVFDSLEAKGLGSRADAVSKIYQAAANDLSHDFPTVTLGKGTSRVDLGQWQEAEDATQALPEAYNRQYTDARQQVLLAKQDPESAKAMPPFANGQAAIGPGENRTLLSTNGRLPLSVRLSDKSADLKAAEKVAKKVYPKGYRYVSDGDALIVLDAAGHGTVGYASIDLQAHEITDLAMLDKFRPHSRVLMKGVYEFLRSNQQQPGQIWNAELRQSTSDRLVNYYDQKGLLTILSRRQVDTMHGEPMYGVRFTLP